MPWRNKTVEKERKEFVGAIEQGETISQACREFGITRRTGYKWLERAKNEESLSDRSHTRKEITNKTAQEIENLILEVRKENPAWGGRTIHKVLKNRGHENLPCVKTCSNILKRNEMIEPKESVKHKACQRFERENNNELWQTDFKGDFLLVDGSRCYPLTIIDDHSRFSIKILVQSNTRGVLAGFREAFYEYGVPQSVLSDNGRTFRGLHGGFVLFEKWLMDHDVLPIHGRIKHPQTQGKIERFHRSMKQELLNHNTYTDLEQVDKALQDWRYKYNHIRPHHAIGMKCPADIYTRSAIEYSDEISKYEYGGQYYVMKVSKWGYLRFDKWQIFLSETMAGEYIEIRASEKADTFIAYYRNFRIAEFDAHSGKRLNRNVYRV